MQSPSELLGSYLGLTIAIEQSFIRIRPRDIALEIWITDIDGFFDTFMEQKHELMGRVDALGCEMLLVVGDYHPRPYTFMVKRHFVKD